MIIVDDLVQIYYIVCQFIEEMLNIHDKSLKFNAFWKGNSKKLLKLSQLRGKNAKFRATMLKLERKMRQN